MDLVDFGWLWKNEELSDFTLIIKPIARRRTPGEADEPAHSSAAGAGGRAARRARGQRGSAAAAAAAAGVVTRRGARTGASGARESPQQRQEPPRAGAAGARRRAQEQQPAPQDAEEEEEEEQQQQQEQREQQRQQQQQAGRRTRGRQRLPLPGQGPQAAEAQEEGEPGADADASRERPPAGDQEAPAAGGRRVLRARRSACAGAGAARCGAPGQEPEPPQQGLGRKERREAPPPAQQQQQEEEEEEAEPVRQQDQQQQQQQQAPPSKRPRRGQRSQEPAVAGAAAGAAGAAAARGDGAGPGPSSLALAAEAEAAAGVRRIPVHAAVLSGMSPYFKVLVRNWSGSLVDRTITLEVGEDEGYAAELMVEFMYTGRLPQDAPPTELLRMIRLADQYQVQRFLSACNASFDSLPLDRIDLGVALSVFALPGLMLDSDALAKVVRKVEHKVHAVFGDLEQVWSQEATRDEFMQLPFRAVLSLLAHKDTAVHNENTVVVALAGWLELGAGRRATVDQRRQLVELVRLPFLTSSYIGDILPNLPWMREVLDTRTLLAAFQFGVASEATRARLVSEFASHPASVPNMRYFRSPRPASGLSKLVFDWSVELAQIKRMAADARLWNRVVEAQSPLHYFAGFYWQLLFNVERTNVADPAARGGGAGGGAGGAGGGAPGAGAGAGAAGGGAPGGAANNAAGGAAAGGAAGAPAGADAAGAGAGGAGAGGADAAGGDGAAAGAAAAPVVVEFVGLRCHATLGLQDAWPRVVRFKANISALQTGFWDMEYVYGKALEGVIQEGVGLGYPGYFSLQPGQLDSDGAWSRFVRNGRVHLRCEVLECE